MAFDGSIAPGDLLNKLMSAAAGRLFRFGGEWFIWPAYWQGPSFAFGESLLVDSIRGARTGLIVSCSTGCLGLTSRLTTRVPSRNLYIDRGYFNGPNILPMPVTVSSDRRLISSSLKTAGMNSGERYHPMP